MVTIVKFVEANSERHAMFVELLSDLVLWQRLLQCGFNGVVHVVVPSSGDPRFQPTRREAAHEGCLPKEEPDER